LKLVLAFSGLFAASYCRADDAWGTWPAGQEPAAVGTRVVQNLLDRPGLNPAKAIAYPETCAGYGAVRFAAEIGDKDLLGKVIARYQGIVAADGTAMLPKPKNVDNSVFGILPLEIYKNTKDEKYLTLGVSYADAQYATVGPDGLSAENTTHYYIDNTFKISAMQILAYRATKKADYAAHAVAELDAFIDKFQQPTGLFYHGADAHVYWGRGNGWVAAALTEVLLYLPANDPGREKIMGSYKAMMAGLLKYQSADGRWRQVVDDEKAWEESSCTGFFIYAMAEGVDQGWLDAGTYGPAVKKAWGALCGHVDAKGSVGDVSVLTEHSNDESYYLGIQRAAGNLHGQFATMWAATALLETKH
jgi:unsaturated rhamnogalacturonyl hydrolase